MAESTIVKTKRDGTITFKDNATPTPLEYVVAYESGDLTINIAGETVNLFLDRGQIGATPAIRYGDDQPVTFSFSAYLRDVSDNTDETLAELLLRSGAIGNNWESQMGANGEVFVVQLQFDIDGASHGESNHQIVLDYCYLTGSLSEGDPSSISINGTAYQVRPATVS